MEGDKGMGSDGYGYKVSVQGNENVLELDSANACTTL